MDKQEANAKLAELAVEIKAKLAEAMALAQVHDLSFGIELEHTSGSMLYTTHIDIDRYGGVDTWQSSAWQDSGCSDGWDDSGC